MLDPQAQAADLRSKGKLVWEGEKEKERERERERESELLF